MAQKVFVINGLKYLFSCYSALCNQSMVHIVNGALKFLKLACEQARSI